VIDSTEQTGNNAETGYATGTVSNIDRIEPNLATIILSNTRVVVGSDITASVTQSDSQSDVDIVRCKWVYTTNSDEIGTTASKYTGGTFATNPEEISLRSAAPGTYYLHVLTEDKAGNKKETISEAVTVVAKVLPKVGDYVAYTPQKTTTSYNFEAKYTGYTSDQEINQEDLQWRVLSVNNNTIELISTATTSKTVAFKEALGYNNGVYLLDDFCNTIYGDVSKKATARSLKIEDIQDKLDLSVWDYHNYQTATNTRYGEVYNFKEKRNYPYQWAQERNSNSKIDGNKTTGTLGMSEQKALTEETSATANTSIEAQQTEWRIRTTANNFIDEIYYQLLINPASGNKTSYTNWLSSRMVYASGSDNAGFGLGSVKYDWVDHDRLYYSAGYGSKLSEHIRPVVSIPLSEIDMSTDYETTGIWNLLK